MDSDAVFGGADMGWMHKNCAGSLVIVLLMLALTIWLIWRGSGENFCGGVDQLCHCGGNETMIGGFYQ